MAWAMPRTPFRGVRISWLMVAKNSLLAWLAASARSSASASAASEARMSVTSVPMLSRPPSSVGTLSTRIHLPSGIWNSAHMRSRALRSVVGALGMDAIRADNGIPSRT